MENQIEPGDGGMRPGPPRAPDISPSQAGMGFMGLQNALHVQLRVFPARLRAAWRSPAPWVLPQVLQAGAEHTVSSQHSRVVPNGSSSSAVWVNKGGDERIQRELLTPPCRLPAALAETSFASD